MLGVRGLISNGALYRTSPPNNVEGLIQRLLCGYPAFLATLLQGANLAKLTWSPRKRPFIDYYDTMIPVGSRHRQPALFRSVRHGQIYVLKPAMALKPKPSTETLNLQP